jgi:adenine/guanine phosphoribosyltransferase-like PRPP-binding protein
MIQHGRLAQSASHLLDVLHDPDLQVVFAVAAIGLLLTAALARAFPINDALNLIGTFGLYAVSA